MEGIIAGARVSKLVLGALINVMSRIEQSSILYPILHIHVHMRETFREASTDKSKSTHLSLLLCFCPIRRVFPLPKTLIALSITLSSYVGDFLRKDPTIEIRLNEHL